MNFRIFGGGLALVGAVLALVGYPQAFPPEPENIPGEVTQGMRDAADCFFNGESCNSSSLASNEPNFTFFVAGLIAIGIGFLMFISTKQEKK